MIQRLYAQLSVMRRDTPEYRAKVKEIRAAVEERKLVVGDEMIEVISSPNHLFKGVKRD